LEVSLKRNSEQRWLRIPFRQAKLLVRNLRWLESLNSEVLELQTKLTHVCKEHVIHVTPCCADAMDFNPADQQEL
jgi:hypothetical protein